MSLSLMNTSEGDRSSVKHIESIVDITIDIRYDPVIRQISDLIPAINFRITREDYRVYTSVI